MRALLPPPTRGGRNIASKASNVRVGGDGQRAPPPTRSSVASLRWSDLPALGEVKCGAAVLPLRIRDNRPPLTMPLGPAFPPRRGYDMLGSGSQEDGRVGAL